MEKMPIRIQSIAKRKTGHHFSQLFSLSSRSAGLKRVRIICCSLLLTITSFFAAGQSVQEPSIVLNDSFAVINGKHFNADQMLAENLFKALGQPDRTDTLQEKSLKDLSSLEMASLVKYEKKGLLFRQGKQTSRVNEIVVFLNPDKRSEYIDYITSPFRGRLVLLGVRIDANTSAKQLETAFGKKYELDVSEEYNSAEMTIFDKKTSARLLEVHFYMKDSMKHIDYMQFRYYPAEPLRKLRMEYRDGQLYLNDLLLDTTSGRTAQLKSMLGVPNAVFDVDYYADHIKRKLRNNIYDGIRGISFLEDPVSKRLVSLKMDFLTLRKRTGLGNPCIELVINKKPFNPVAAVTNGPHQTGTSYGLDSIRVDQPKESGKNTTVTAYEKNANLQFEFDGNYNFSKSVYYFTYEPVFRSNNMAASGSAAATASPEFKISKGKIWLNVNGKRIDWDFFSRDAKSSFFSSLGKPDQNDGRVSEYAEYGFRIWSEKDLLSSIAVYLTPYTNPYSKAEESPGIFKGTVMIEDQKITKELTIEDVQRMLPAYQITHAYDNQNESMYTGKSNGIKVYFSFHRSSGKLASFSVDHSG